MTIVNTGDCRSFLEKNTLDPILFLETGNLSTITPTASTIEKIIEKQESPTALKIEKTKIKSRAEIIEEDITEYLRKYEIDVGIPSTGIMLNLGEYIELPISVRMRGGGLVDLSLPEPGVEILFDPKMVSIFPEKIIFLENGVRSFRISPLKTGNSTLSFRLGKRIIATSRIFVGKR